MQGTGLDKEGVAAAQPINFTRPSILQPKAYVDSWVGICSSEHLVVYLNNQPISLFPGSALDQSSLNDLLFALHHRFPRQNN